MATRSVSKSERLKKSLKRQGLILPHGYQTQPLKKRKTTSRKKTTRPPKQKSNKWFSMF
jgi:hypothetical protein